MKTHKKIGITFRPLLLTTVVGLACQQYAMAQAAPAPTPAAANERTSPFAPRPPHVDNLKTQTSKKGIPANVLFMIDDSGSMQTALTHRGWAGQDRCTWTVEYNRTHKDKCFAVYYRKKANGGLTNDTRQGARTYYTFREPTRIQVAIDGMNAMLDNPNYKGKVTWGVYSLWGTEKRFMTGGLPDRGDTWDTEDEKDSIPGHKWTGWDNRYKTKGLPEFTGFKENPADVRDLVNSLSPYIDTPTTDRYVRAVREIRKNIKYRCQENYIVVLSDGDANTDEIPGYPFEQKYSNPTGFLQWEKDYYGKFERWGVDPNDFGAGPWYRYYSPGQTSNPSWYSPYFGTTKWGGLEKNGIGLFSRILASKDLIKAGGRPDMSNDSKDAEGGDWDDPKYEKQLITTFAIGFGDSLSSAGITYLKGAATCPNCFHTAKTGEELKDTFGKILDSIAKPDEIVNLHTRTTATPAVTGSSIATIAASASIDTQKWASVLLFNWFDRDGKTILEGAPDPAKYDERSVFIVNNGKGGRTDIYDLQATDTSRKADFGLASDEEFTKAFVPWIKRDPGKTDKQIQDDAKDIASKRVSKYRIRTEGAGDVQRQMGDILGAPITALGKDDQGKQKYVITAANDGLLYIFRSTGATGPGSSPYTLKLNYLPAGIQRESKDDTLTIGKTLPLIAEEGYGQSEDLNPHLYLNNGGISWYLTPATNGHKQEFVLLGNVGQGGRGSYALSVAGEKRGGSGKAGLDAPESTWLSGVPMWETDKSAGNALGYTVSTPTIAQTAAKWDTTTKKANLEDGVRIYAYLANGYRPGTYDDKGKFTPNLDVTYDRTPTLYVYEMMGQEFGTNATSPGQLENGAKPGAIISKISVPSGADVGPGALSTPTLVDTDLNGVVDIAYAGDEFGNLYRFDLRSEVGGWKASMIYKGDKIRPITAAPTVYRNDENDYIVVFGTGSDIFKHDRRDANQQMIAGIYDDLKVEAPTALSFGDLFAQSYTRKGDARYIADAGFDKARNKGWKIMLDPSVASDAEGYFVGAEKVVSKPQMLLSTAFVPTRIYSSKDEETKLPPGVDKNKTCYESNSSKATKGTSWTMAINVKNGAGPDLQNGGYFTDPNTGDGVELAGKYYDNITSGVNIIDTKKVEPTIQQSNGNGEYRTDGEGQDLKNLKFPRNDCIEKGAEIINVQSKADKNSATSPATGSGKVITEGVSGKRCGDPSFTRGTKREIKL